MIKYPKTGQFRQVVNAVRKKYRKDNPNFPAILPYMGTVKLHGTNASVVLMPDGKIIPQSRNRKLSIESDNAGFAFFVNTVKKEIWLNLFSNLLGVPQDKLKLPLQSPVTLYGEWCGDSIQKGVAISQLPKMFVVFALRMGTDENSEWIDIEPHGSLNLDDMKIYSIFDKRFPVYKVFIDFRDPKSIQNQLIEFTKLVEKECPVAKAFGISGIGEGVVWKCMDPQFSSDDLWFKVKGEKHSATKVKKLAEVDPEKMRSSKEFVESVVTQSRLQQGIEYLKEFNKEISRKSTGDYIKWVVSDVLKEELDTLFESNLEPKDVTKQLGEKARIWFFDYIDNQTFSNGDK